MKMNNNKGFTFVEILAVIVIIGLLTGISIAAFSRYKENAIKSDYEALARSSYSAMEEYMMSHPYTEGASLEELEAANLISNRKDPGTKESNCEGSVILDKNAGSNGKIDDGKYTVYLCCVGYMKKYTYPDGKVIEMTSEEKTNKCNYTASDPSTPDPDPSTPPTPADSSVTCSAGKYLPKNSATCANCKSGNYCKGGTWNTSTTSDQGLTPCPAGYKNSAAGSSKIEQCYMNVVAGKYVKNKKDITQTACGKGTYKEAHNVYYNGTSKCTNCPAGYRDGAGAPKAANCIMKVPKNNYVKKAKDSKPTACPSGQLKDQHNVYYGKISSCSSKTITVTFDCNGGTRSGPASVKYKSDVTGQKFTTTCTKKGYNQDGWKRDKNGTASNYTTYSGVSERFVLTYTPKITIYAHWKIESVTCKAGQYLPKAKISCTTCPANNYCPGGTYNYNATSNQGINACPSGYGNSAAGSDASSDCYMKVPVNKYVKKAKDKTAKDCPSGQYKEAHNVHYGKVSNCSGKTITVTFDCNGGTRNGSATATYNSSVAGQKFTTTCTKNGYTQDGWKRTKTGSAKNYETASGVSENFVLTYTPKITLYAHWVAKPPTCTIKPERYPNSNGWFNKDIKLIMTTTGQVSQKGLAKTSNSTNGSTSVNVTDNGTTTYYGYVKGAGGTNTCSYTVKLDKKPPTCSFTKVYNKYVRGNNINLTATDNISKSLTIQYSTDNKNYKAYSNAAVSKSCTNNITYYGRAIDQAGNTSSVCSATFVPGNIVNGKYYFSDFETAINNTSENGTLTAQCSYNDSTEAEINKSITFDTAGKTIQFIGNRGKWKNGTMEIIKGKKLTIKGSGTIKSTYKQRVILVTKGTLELNNATIYKKISSDTGACVKVVNGTFNMNSGTVECSAEAVVGNNGDKDKSQTLNIKGGKVSHSQNSTKQLFVCGNKKTTKLVITKKKVTLHHKKGKGYYYGAKDLCKKGSKFK